jgi:putative hydroxymethylpyrimidine transport system substrate-binding protein
MTRKLALGALVLLSALGLAACGEKVDRVTPNASETQSISLALDTTPNATHVGIYQAQADGEFRRAGLRVQISSPPAGSSAMNEVESGKVDVGIISEPELMIQRDRYATVLAFGAIAQKPLAALISFGSRHITSFSALQGKTVGVTGAPGQSEMLTAALKAAGVPNRSVRRVALGAGDLVAAMKSKRVDATFGGTAAGLGATLRRAGDKPNIVPITQAGVPNYDELVFTCKEVYFENHVNQLRRFVQAIGRGYVAVRADPAAGVRALVAADPQLKPAVETAAVKQTLPALFPSRGKSWGWQFGGQWNTFGKWLVAKKILRHPAWYEASTNQLLAGVGP